MIRNPAKREYVLKGFAKGAIYGAIIGCIAGLVFFGLTIVFVALVKGGTVNLTIFFLVYTGVCALVGALTGSVMYFVRFTPTEGQFGIGVAYALNERLSLSLSYTQRFIGETKTKLEGQDWAEIIGSDAAVGILNTGLTYAITDNLTMVTNIGAGLTEDAADVTFSIGFPYNF